MAAAVSCGRKPRFSFIPTQVALAYAPEAVYLPHMSDKMSGSVQLEAEWWPRGERFFSLSEASQED